jgi:hypothetical protein
MAASAEVAMNSNLFRFAVLGLCFAAGGIAGWLLFSQSPMRHRAPAAGAKESPDGERSLGEAPAEFIGQAARAGTIERVDEAQLRRAFAAYRASHPKEAVLVARQFVDPRCAELWYRIACETLPCEEAWAALREIPSHLRMGLARDLAVRWAVEDGRRAVETFLASEADEGYQLHPQTLAADAFSSWSEKDAVGAAQWLATSLEAKAPGNPRMQARLFTQARLANAGKMLQTLERIPGALESPVLAETYGELAYLFGTQSPEQAITWAKAVPDAHHRNQALQQVAFGLAIQGRTDQAISLASEAGSTEARVAIYHMAARYMRKEDPAKAERWAEGITDPLLRAEARRALGK